MEQLIQFQFLGKKIVSGIYKFTNSVNGRFYIGSCKSFRTRWGQHIKQLIAGTHPNTFLQNDFNKCGSTAFAFEVIELVDGKREDRLAREQVYLTQFYDKQKQCYNLCDRAISREGIKSRNPEATKARHVAASKEIWKHPEYRARQSEIQSQRTKELWQDPDYRTKHEEKIREFTQTDEYRQKLSEAAKAKWQNPEFQEKAKATYQSEEFKQKVSENSRRFWENEEHRIKQSEARKTAWRLDPNRKLEVSDRMKARMAKTYTLLSPTGEIITFTNMSKFCLEHSLQSSGLCNVAKGKWLSYKGWTKPI